MTITNQDAKKLSFLKKVNSSGEVVLVACPSDFRIGTSTGQATADLTVTGGGWIGGPETAATKTASSGGSDPKDRQGKFQITHDSDNTFTATGGDGSTPNMTYSNMALHLRNNTGTDKAYTAIAMTATSEVDANSIGAAIVAQRDHSGGTGGGAKYATNLHLCTNKASDNACLPRMTITHTGTVGIGTVVPFGSTGDASSLAASSPNGGLHVYGKGYPTTIFQGETHSLNILTASAGGECSVHFRSGKWPGTMWGTWTAGMDSASSFTTTAGFSIKTTNNQDPEFYIHTDGKIAMNSGGVSAAPTEALEVADDTDSSAIIGRAQVGYMSYTDYAGFSHRDRASAGNYALLQHSNGTTYLNASVGKSILIRNGNNTSDVSQASEATVKVYNPYNTSWATKHILDLYSLKDTGTTGINTNQYIRFLEIQDWSTSPPGTETLLGSIIGDGAGAVELSGFSFTGQHATVITSGSYEIGMIAESTGEIWVKNTETLSTALPKVQLTLTEKSKTVYGVISNLSGSFEGYIANGGLDADEMHIVVNSIGEGFVLVTNYNGDVQNGDYIVSSPIAGYGMRQDDDLLRSSTVAKCTESVDWTLIDETIVAGENTYKLYLVGCTYHCG